MQVKRVPQIFKNHLLFSSICEYFSIRQMLALATVNRQLNTIVQNYFRNMQKQLQMRPTSRKSAIHQLQFYFNRCLKIVKQDRNLDLKSANLITIYDPFKFETVKYFQVGSVFTCYLTRDQKARIFKTSQLLNLYEKSIQLKRQKDNNPITPNYQNRKNIKSIKCKSDQCVLLKQNGQVLLLSTNKNQELVVSSQQVIEWTCRVPIRSIYNSYLYTIFLPESIAKIETVLAQVFNKNEQQLNFILKQLYHSESENSNLLIARNMVTNKQFMIEIPCSQVIQCSVGSKYAYFISSKNQVFQADLQQKLQHHLPIIKAKIFEPFRGKTIAKITSGYYFFIALEKNIQQIQQWDTQRVVQWLREIGFEAYIKIARYEKLDGKKLINIQKKYMHNVLGITTQNMQQKFIMSIEQKVNKKSTYQQLWGWGKNQSGQLGSSNANFVTKPQKIKTNCLQQGQNIDSVFCGWFQTFIRTQKGRIYCTQIKTSKRRKESQTEKQIKQESQQQTKVMHSDDEEEQLQKQVQQLQKKGSRKKSRGNPNKKKKKTTQSHKQLQKQKGNHKFKEQQCWYQFGLGKAFFMQTFKDILFVVQCPNQTKEQLTKTKKLRPAKVILDKILWSNLSKQQFKVGYLDKDMGIIQASAIDMQKFDVKENRVKYFKRNGTIVWDRDSKIDLF